MATNPKDIQLNEEDRLHLAKVADKSGKSWRQTFREAIVQYEQSTVPPDEVDIDEKIRAVFGVEPDAVEQVSVEEMQHILAKCSGSLADDIIADREDRL